jgi:DNA-binding MarR family transcriptional regulator
MNEESIGRLVSILYRMGKNHIEKQLEPYGIGSGQVPSLTELFTQDGICQEELVSLIRCDKATVARALQRLESQGYVERKRSAEDGRVNLVYLTDKAHNFKRTLFLILSNWTDTLAQGLNREERKQVINLLSRLVENATANKLGEGE